MILNVKIQSVNRSRHGFLRENPEGKKTTGRTEKRFTIFYVLQEDFLFIGIHLLFLLLLFFPFFYFVEECWSISKLFGVTDGAEPSP